jgi:hypothetical protein
MTTLVVDRFYIPTTLRGSRRIDLASRRTLHELAGRTIWSVSAISAGRDSTDRFMDRFRWCRDEGVTTARIEPAGRFADVNAGDLVFLHDPGTTRLAQLAREQGAHVVCLLDADDLPARSAAVDAYVMAWSGRVAAVMPAPCLMSLKEVERRLYEDLGWGSLLADIVHSDRDERVGGRLHPRPSVAAR